MTATASKTSLKKLINLPKLASFLELILKTMVSAEKEKENCCLVFTSSVKVLLHETIRNDDFKRNTSLQCWNNVAIIQNNVATVL